MTWTVCHERTSKIGVLETDIYICPQMMADCVCEWVYVCMCLTQKSHSDATWDLRWDTNHAVGLSSCPNPYLARRQALLVLHTCTTSHRPRGCEGPCRRDTTIVWYTWVTKRMYKVQWRFSGPSTISNEVASRNNTVHIEINSTDAGLDVCGCVYVCVWLCGTVCT